MSTRLHQALRIPAVALILLVSVVVARPAAAQGGNQMQKWVNDVLQNGVLKDINRLLANGPVYLSSRLPIMALGGDLAAGKPLGRFPDFSVGLNFHSGLTTDFRHIAYGLETLPNFQKELPDIIPLPTISISGRLGIIEDLEVSLKFFFIPEVEIALPGDMNIASGMIDVGAQVRWRFFRSRSKAIPELVAMFSFNYFTGFLKIGANMQTTYDSLLNQKGTLRMKGAPVLGWDVFVLSPELRVAWNVAWFHPYFGLGFDFSFGEVDGGLTGRMTFDDPIIGQVELWMNTTNTMEIPRIFGLRPTFGMEFDCGRIFRIVVEGNLEMTAHQRPNSKLAQEFKDDMKVGGNPQADADMGYLYNKANAKKGGIDPLSYAFGLGLRVDFE